ncbi:MAG: divalent metal cation transporter [Streptosporangiales bacterium]|nr:divalent metal cation transporter [Streptosporangiales bacterium]
MASNDPVVEETPKSWSTKLAVLGPGLVLAGVGVGAGDMVTGLAGGAEFGMALAWAIAVGAIVKWAVTEGIGRWYLATGQTPVQGIHSLGRVASTYFVVYLAILGFVFGGAVISATGLSLAEMFPVMPVAGWAVVTGIAGFLIVFIGRYRIFEMVMKVLVGTMFIGVVGAAALTLPSFIEIVQGFVPTLPPGGSFLYALGIVGGVGATLTLAAYGYWLREKGWRGSGWIGIMRVDLAAGYILTFIFVFAMMVIGTEFLFGTGRGIDGSEGMAALADPFGERFGSVARWLFLIGFFSTTFSSVVGAWNGMSFLFADYVRLIRGIPDEQAEEHTKISSPAFRAFLAWVAFPPMLLLLFGQPVFLVIVYAALGALAMPFLVIVLLFLLNSKAKVEAAYRNKLLANALYAAILLMFLFLGGSELIGLFQGET